MEHWEKAELSSSGRPILRESETLFLTQAQVGLYDRDRRLADTDSGLLYLTSHRLIHVSSSKSASSAAVGLRLDLVSGVDSIAGFLASHPKIIVYLPTANSLLSPVRSVSGSAQSSISDLQQQQAPRQLLYPQNWTCPICAHSSNTISLPPTLGASLPASGIPSLSLRCQQCGVVSDLTSPALQVSCWQCTLWNRGTDAACSMCSATLWMVYQVPVEVPTTPAAGSSGHRRGADGPKSSVFIKLSFRAGGQQAMYARLKQCLETQSWMTRQPTSPVSTPSSNTDLPVALSQLGVSGVMRNASQAQQQQQSTMDAALGDLKSLMEKAEEMVRISETIVTRLKKAQSDSVSGGEDADDTETREMREMLLNLGIQDPVTKDSSGSAYFQELARQLSDFMQPLLAKNGGMMTLADAYCFYNRARGVALVSPQDMYEACRLMAKLGLAIHFHEYASGLRVLLGSGFDQESIARKVGAFVSGSKAGDKGVSALQVAKELQWSVLVAREALLQAEQRLLLCRDDSPNGLLFYTNLFMAAESK